MVRIIFCTIFLLLLFTNCFSQIDEKGSYPEKAITLRTNPFSFLQRDAGVMIGVNYRWKPRWSATVDPKFIFYGIPRFSDNDLRYPLGVRVKTDIRYHFKESDFLNFYVAPELVYGYVRTRSTTTFGINCVNGNCAYYMQEKYTEIKKERGGALKFGMIGPVRKRNPNWKLDFYWGIGVSFFDFKYKNIPAGGSFERQPVPEYSLGNINIDGSNLTIPVGLTITHRIK